MTPTREGRATPDPRPVVLEHLDAFNEHSTDRLLARFAADAVWTTGGDVFEGRAALSELFDDGLWALNPSLAVRTLLADGEGVAAELRETLTIDGEQRRFDIAVFFDVRGGLISRATVYREGSADLD